MLKEIKIKACIVRDNTAAMRAAVQALVGVQVLVGVPAENADRRDDEEPISNAALAYVHNTGSPAQNIPQREFMRSGIESEQQRIENYMGQGAKHGMRGDKNAMLRSLHAAGSMARDGMRRKLDAGPFKPLAPGTLAARKRRGRTGEKPLQDTGQLRNSLNYVVREKGNDK